MNKSFAVVLVTFFLTLATGSEAARADWVFLKDGRVGQSKPSRAGQLSVTFPDGTTEKVPKNKIQKTRTEAAVNKTVDETIGRMLRSGGNSKTAKPYIALKAAAVPRLVYHLRSRRRNYRVMAMFGLNYCWSPVARQPVAALLKGRNKNMRVLAITALEKHESPEIVTELLTPLLGDRNAAIAGRALGALEKSQPNVVRMSTFLANRNRWKYAWRHLPRYHCPELTASTLQMLARGKTQEKLAAVCALIHQNANSPEIRTELTNLLRFKVPAVRDMAAEYLSWHGRDSEIAAIEAALEREKDPYATASMTAAIAAVKLRANFMSKDASGPQENSGSKSAGQASYAEALEILNSEVAAGTWQKAFDIYARAEQFEPVWKYGTTLSDSFAKQRMNKLRTQRLLFAIPWQQVSRLSFSADTETPVAQSLMPPVRKYMDPKRKSYGHPVSGQTGPFAGKIHVGDDVAFYKDHATVVAIGDGLVMVVDTTHSWGGRVIIEHRLPDGARFFSLYAHLSPFIHVRPGQKVTKGQKIGSVGRSFTWENGGYPAHLHLGIRRIHPGIGQRFEIRLKGKEVPGTIVKCEGRTLSLEYSGGVVTVTVPAPRAAGYLSPKKFGGDKHGWTDPQAFIREHTRHRQPTTRPGMID